LLGWLTILAFGALVVVLVRVFQTGVGGALTIGAGKTEETVQQFVKSLSVESARQWMAIKPVIVSGTLDMLDQVERGELDFAVVHGGLDMDSYHNIRQVGVLSIAPVHLLVKKEYHAAVSSDLQNLRGRSVNLGNGNHTVMFWLSQEVLAFAGLSREQYEPRVIRFDEIERENDPSRLPDAIFISTMPPSDLVRRLVVKFGYRLVAIPFGDAFRLTALEQVARPLSEGIRKENIVDATIPAYAYEASPAVPPQTIATLGLRVLLITNTRMNNATVTKLLDLMIASRFAEAMQPSLDAGIVRQHGEVPWHSAAIEYRRRDEPLVTGERIGLLSNVLQILLPAEGMVLLILGWLRNRVLVRQELRFDRFIALVSGVERRALELGAKADREAVQQLHRELSTIKDAALERITIGEASDHTLVTSLFSHIRDVRILLADLEVAPHNNNAKLS
jgi:TRAP-type uncharacterized transport system substrate-binding protein